MKNNMVTKSGISWIEIKDKVHTIVGDGSHTRSKEIYAKLENQSDLSNKAGYVPTLEIDLHDVLNDITQYWSTFHKFRLMRAVILSCVLI